jgi:hypothetical protein
MDDALRIHELLVRCEVQDCGEPHADLRDLTLDWKQINLFSARLQVSVLASKNMDRKNELPRPKP